MDKSKATRQVLRKIARAKPCPFCGRVPKIRARVDEQEGSIGHYIIRESCCPATQMGQTELFFSTGRDPANYGLWKQMVDRLIDNWNRRV